MRFVCFFYVHLYHPHAALFPTYSYTLYLCYRFFYFTIRGNRTFSCCRDCDLFLIMVSLIGIHHVLSEFRTCIQSLFSTHGNIISVYNIRKYTYLMYCNTHGQYIGFCIMNYVFNRSNRTKGYFCKYITIYRPVKQSEKC